MAVQGEMFGKQTGSVTLNTNADAIHNTLQHIHVEKIQPGLGQPREIFSPQALADLTASVKQHGILQPLIVRHVSPRSYEIVAGERRWRAAQKAGLAQVPCLIVEATDRKTIALALIENIQREDLNALEEAKAYQRLLQTCQYTQKQLAEAVGKDRSAVSNSLRLLKLPHSVKKLIINKKLTGGHARALASLPPEQAQSLANRIAQQGMTVRQAERLARESRISKNNDKKIPPSLSSTQESFVHRQIRQRLEEHFKTSVQLHHSQGEEGRIVLRFRSAKELNRLLQLLTLQS